MLDEPSFRSLPAQNCGVLRNILRRIGKIRASAELTFRGSFVLQAKLVGNAENLAAVRTDSDDSVRAERGRRIEIHFHGGSRSPIRPDPRPAREIYRVNLPVFRAKQCDPVATDQRRACDPRGGVELPHELSFAIQAVKISIE